LNNSVLVALTLQKFGEVNLFSPTFAGYFAKYVMNFEYL